MNGGPDIRYVADLSSFELVPMRHRHSDVHADCLMWIQPVDHLQFEGLGSTHDLRELCQECEKVSMRVIADVVFNHMAVVARRSEWLKAQKDPRFMEELLQRLDHRFRPLDRTDFHPWKDMIVSPFACLFRAFLPGISRRRPRTHSLITREENVWLGAVQHGARTSFLRFTHPALTPCE